MPSISFYVGRYITHNRLCSYTYVFYFLFEEFQLNIIIPMLFKLTVTFCLIVSRLINIDLHREKEHKHSEYLAGATEYIIDIFRILYYIISIDE